MVEQPSALGSEEGPSGSKRGHEPNVQDKDNAESAPSQKRPRRALVVSVDDD